MRGAEETENYEKFADNHFSIERYDNWYSWVEETEATITSNYFSHHDAYIKEKKNKSQQYYEMIGKYLEFVQGWDDPDPDMSFESEYRQQVDAGNREILAIKEINNSEGENPDTVWYYVKREGDDLTTPPDTNATLEEGDRQFSFGYSANQLKYMELRNNATNAYRFSRTLLTALATNHFISGINAALSASAHNNNIKGEEQTVTNTLKEVRLEPLSASDRYGKYIPGVALMMGF